MPTQSPSNKRGVLIAILAVLIVVFIGVIVFFAVNPSASNENSGTSNSATTSETVQPPSEESATQDETIIARTPNGDIRIDMPKKYADLGYQWNYINNELRFQNKDGLTAVIIYQGSYTLSYEEAVADYYGLGNTIISGTTTPVSMKVLFWQKGSDGLGLIHGADPIGDGKPSLGFIGITPEEVASWILLEQNESYHKATLTAPSTPSADTTPEATYTSPTTTPFYGVWIGAFSEKWRAEEFCNEARSSRGLNAEIFLSNQWTNLNQDPYWVVAAFVTPSQQIAERQLMSIQAAGYTNAYVKYSGNYKG